MICISIAALSATAGYIQGYQSKKIIFFPQQLLCNALASAVTLATWGVFKVLSMTFAKLGVAKLAIIFGAVSTGGFFVGIHFTTVTIGIIAYGFFNQRKPQIS